MQAIMKKLANKISTSSAAELCVIAASVFSAKMFRLKTTLHRCAPRICFGIASPTTAGNFSGVRFIKVGHGIVPNFSLHGIVKSACANGDVTMHAFAWILT